MNKDEVVALLRTSDVKIAFDTNALESDRRFNQLCNSINRINQKFRFQLQLTIPTLAYFEKLYHLKQKHSDSYDFDLILKGLQGKQVQIMSFEPIHAEGVVGLIHTQFSTREEWLAAKIKRCAKCLGINEKIVSGSKKCSATVDWLIAGYAIKENSLLITNDQGIEFKDVNKKTTLEIFEQAIQELLVDKI